MQALEAERKLILLVRAEGRRGEELGRELMQHGHTVFLSDADSDIEFLGDVLDAVIDVRALDRGQAAVLCTFKDRSRPSRDKLRDAAVLELPASYDALADFEHTLKTLQQ
jgi:hypothetical protein